MHSAPYRWQTSVRSYELDSQGIVNNATYLNYLEQARNDYVHSLGLDHVEYEQNGYTFVVAHIGIDYRASLTYQTAFYVTAAIIGHSDKRIHFEQEIRFKSNDKLASKAKVDIACVDLNTGRACMPEVLKQFLQGVMAK